MTGIDLSLFDGQFPNLLPSMIRENANVEKFWRQISDLG